jgi:hypothetical protein
VEAEVDVEAVAAVISRTATKGNHGWYASQHIELSLQGQFFYAVFTPDASLKISEKDCSLDIVFVNFVYIKSLRP